MSCINALSLTLIVVSFLTPLNIDNTALSAFLDPVVGLGHPVSGAPGLDAVVVQLIDLFKRQALGFRDEEIGEKETAETGGSPDEEHLDFETCIARAGLDEVGSGIADSPVPEPVGGGGHGHGFGADTLRIRREFLRKIREDRVRR